MTAIHQMDRKKGLDLILHTPGGGNSTTESLVDYLFLMFGTNIKSYCSTISTFSRYNDSMLMS